MTDSRYDDTAIGFWERTGVANDRSIRPDRSIDVEVWADRFAVIDPTDPTKRQVWDVSALPTATDAYASRVPVLSGTANLALTALMSRSLILIDGASLAFTLPAITAAEIGVYYDFRVTVVSTAVSITAQAADLLSGAVWIADFDTANTGSYFKADEVDDLIFSMNGTTKGGKIGTAFRFEAVSATRWFVSAGGFFGDGTLATPFA